MAESNSFVRGAVKVLKSKYTWLTVAALTVVGCADDWGHEYDMPADVDAEPEVEHEISPEHQAIINAADEVLAEKDVPAPTMADYYDEASAQAYLAKLEDDINVMLAKTDALIAAIGDEYPGLKQALEFRQDELRSVLKSIDAFQQNGIEAPLRREVIDELYKITKLIQDGPRNAIGDLYSSYTGIDHYAGRAKYAASR